MKKKPAITKPATSVLTLPPTAPPPRKEDIINAMVERARVKHEEQRHLIATQRQAAVDALNEALLKELKEKPESFCINFNMYDAPEIKYSLDVVPPHIRKLREKVREAPYMRGFDAAEVRRKIRDQYQASSSDRVRALLASPDAVKALDAALAKIA